MDMDLAIQVEGGAISPGKAYRCMPHESMLTKVSPETGISVQFFWLAHSSISHETEEFRTKEAAKAWLKMISDVDSSRSQRGPSPNLPVGGFMLYDDEKVPARTMLTPGRSLPPNREWLEHLEFVKEPHQELVYPVDKLIPGFNHTGS